MESAKKRQKRKKYEINIIMFNMASEENERILIIALRKKEINIYVLIIQYSIKVYINDLNPFANA